MELILKTSAILLLFYLCYKFFLERETFFEGNRWFLLSGLLMATALPFVVIPVYVEFTPIHETGFVAAASTTINNAQTTAFTLKDVLFWSYISGVILLLVKLLTDIVSLLLLIRKGTTIKNGKFTYVEIKKDILPFSFFNWIVYNPNQFDDIELKHIINHEKAHATQYHSLDIMAMQLTTIALWFNPLVWLYKKELKQNLEFIADQNAQVKSNCGKSYQMLMVRTSTQNLQLALANNFYNSLIKKRIVMLHKSKSNKLRAWKYALVLPAIALFLMSFNTKTIYIEKPVEESAATWVNKSIDYLAKPNNESKTKTTENSKQQAQKKQSRNHVAFGDIEMHIISKDFSDADFDKLKATLDKSGIKAKFKGIKRNDSGEITAIKIDLNGKGTSSNYNISGDEPIAPIKISYDGNGQNISIGNVSLSDNIHVVSSSKNLKFGDKDKNVFVFSSDGNSKDEIIINKKTKVKHSGKNNAVIHITTDEDEDEDHNVEIIEVVKQDIDTDVDPKVEEIIVINKGKDKTWTQKNVKEMIVIDEDGEHIEIDASEHGNNKVFIAGDNKKALFIKDGKEVSKEDIMNLNPSDIDSVTVLKGDAATEKYGKKAKDGVVIIKTKKN